MSYHVTEYLLSVLWILVSRIHPQFLSAPASSEGALKGKLGIKSHHGTFIGAPNSSATCSSKSLGGDEIIEVVEIKANTVALKSKHGKYLSSEFHSVLIFPSAIKTLSKLEFKN